MSAVPDDFQSNSSPASGIILACFSGLLWLALGASDAGAQALTCAAWCDLMSNHCPEEVFHDEEFCNDYCGHPSLNILAPGSLTDETGNTLGCRINHALQAEVTAGAEREAHCAAAAMTGGGVCGSYCDVYCDLAIEICNTTNNIEYTGTPLFTSGGVPSRPQCLATCAAYPEDVLDGISQTDQLFGYGDTVQCRIHHLEAAAVDGQENTSSYGLHCGHAKEISDSGLCSDIVEPNVINYCVFSVRHCSGVNAILPDGTEHSECVSILNETLIAGDYSQDGFTSFTDTNVNSVGCLNNRIMLAAQDPATYCAEGDWDSANWVPEGSAVCALVTSPVPAGRVAPWLLVMLIPLVGAAALAFPRTRRS